MDANAAAFVPTASSSTVVAAIVADRSHVLLLRRPRQGGETLLPPAATLSPGESITTAAARAFASSVGPLPTGCKPDHSAALSYQEPDSTHLMYWYRGSLHSEAAALRGMLNRREGDARSPALSAVLLPWSDIDSHRRPDIDASSVPALRHFKLQVQGSVSADADPPSVFPVLLDAVQRSPPQPTTSPDLITPRSFGRFNASAAMYVSDAARVAVVQQFLADHRRPDGSTAFDAVALRRFLDSCQARALARGSQKVTARDVRDAAALLTRAPRASLVPSPADVEPEHLDQLTAALAAVHEDVAQSKSGGVALPRVLILGETSGVVARAFRAAGADVATCDLCPTSTPEIPHFHGDASYIQDKGWHLVIAHPPCTYLSNAGVQYLYTEPGRRARLEEAVGVFQRMRAAKAPFVAVEQPKIHRHARELLGGLQPTQYVHPWQHGTGHTKPTALYLTRLPPLRPTCEVAGRDHALADLPPGPDRGARRSRTYKGIAAAMAIQWTPVLLDYIRENAPEPFPPTAANLVAAATASSEIAVAGAVTHRPWELARPIRDGTLYAPVRRLHRLRGRWYALARQESSDAYAWTPTEDGDNSTIDAIAGKYDPSESGLSAGLHDGVWRVTSAAQSDTVDDAGQDAMTQVTAKWVHPAVAASISTLAPTTYFGDVRRSAETDARWQSSSRLLDRALTQGKRSGKLGLRTKGEHSSPRRPPLSTPDQWRVDYAHSFVSGGTQGAVLQEQVAASVALASDPTDVATVEFPAFDIADPPPPLKFTPQCAYIRDFVVSRVADTRQSTPLRFRVDVAACRVPSSLSDTGAGPSCIGSAVLAKLPKDAAVSRSHVDRADGGLVGADGKPLLTRGTVDIVFTLGGHAFRHQFTVVEGGDLLLLGNDFLALYRARVTPLDENDEGHIEMTVTKKGARQTVRVPLSCRPTPLPRAISTVAAIETDASPAEPPVETGDELPPALIPFDDSPSASSPSPPPSTDPTANERYQSEFRTEDYLLYSEQPISIPARTETTVWLRVPLALREFSSDALVDRLPPRLGLAPAAMTACSLVRINSEGLVPVTLLNAKHRQVTVPASSPVARLEVGCEVSQAGALDPTATDLYERLSEDERKLVDSVSVDPSDRLSVEQKRRVRDLLARHSRVFALNPKSPAHTHLMEVELPLKEGAVPHRHAASRLGEAGSVIVDQHCAEMEANGIIRKSNSAWGSRVVLVKKKGGETRFCIDFRDLNAKLRTCDSPIPRCDEAIDRLASGAGPQDSLFLCTLDLASGFWTLPIAEKDKGLTAFVTRRQKYEFNYLPFGVQSGPSYMCRLMDAALQGLAWEICMPYLDDVGIWSTGVGADFDSREEASFEQMMVRLDLVLERLAWAGLSAKASKCVLFATSAEYLGHVISRRGLEMDPAKIEKIKAINPTEINSIEKVRAFVGLCSYYRRFVPGFARVTAPLSDLTKDGVDVAVESQKPAAQTAIAELIDIMTTEPVVLRMPRFDRQFIVKTDGAQTEGIGGLLNQHDDEGHERVVAYYGRRLTKAERNYTVTEIELLAALECIRNWRPYLWGRRFKLIIDHAALKWLHTMKDTIEGGPASRLTRWNLKLLEYDFEVEHKPGKNHADADAVSRLVAAIASTRRRVTTSRTLQADEREARAAADNRETIVESYVNTNTPGVEEMIQAQQEDPECLALLAFHQTGDDLILKPQGSTSLRLARWARREARYLRVINQLLYRIDPIQPSKNGRAVPSLSPRLFIPRDLREAYLHAFHAHLGHLGQSRMYATMRRRVYWPGMAKDIREHVSECHECTLAKRLTRRLAQPRRAEFGAYPFDIVVCDMCSMTLSHDGRYDKLLVFADSLTRWVEAVPFLGDPSAAAVLDAFSTHVACRYGWPRVIRSDGGSNLASLLTDKILELTGVDKAQGGKYHPESQGIAERVQGTLIEMCRAADEGGSHWPDHLPFLLFSYHATPHRITGHSPAMLLYGRELRLPSQLDELTGGTPDAADATVADSALPSAVREYAAIMHRRLVAAWQTARDSVSAEQERHAADAFVSSDTTKSFEPGDRVCYRLYDRANKLHSAWFGPCRVSANLGGGNYRLRDLPNRLMSSRFHVSQLRPYRAKVDAEELADDEYLVDELLDARTRRGTREYKVKWRQHPLSDASWVPRAELLRRCADLVHAYDGVSDATADVASPEPTANSSSPQQPFPAPRPPAAYDSDDVPFAAKLTKGAWTYGRRVATPRGLSTRWFPAAAFTPDELESAHFTRLRDDAASAAPSRVASAFRTIADTAHTAAVVISRCFCTQ